MRKKRALSVLGTITLLWPVPVVAQDAPMCLTEPAEIVGTEGPDRLEGTPQRDVIVGLGGDDVILGLGGSDVICGDAGDDSVYGGRERLPETAAGVFDDHLFGNDGNDLLHGTTSGTLRGGAGDDVLMYGTASYLSAPNGVVIDLDAGTATGYGSDELVGVQFVIGSPFADSISGDETENSFSAGGGDDVLSGRGGRDYLWGQSGNDELDGGAGGDVDLWGGPGDDAIFGGPGDDTLTGDGFLTPAAEFGDDVLDGGEGYDEVTYNEGEIAAVTVDLAAGTATGHGQDVLSGFEFVHGSDADDSLFGDEHFNNLWGARGEDVIDGRGGADWLNATSALAWSDEGDEDRLIGGAGPDHFSVPECCGFLELNGGSGIDLADFYSTDPDAFLVAYLGGVFEMKWTGGYLFEIENVSGTAGTDRIVGDDGPNLIRGRSGRDQIEGAGGDDRLVGGRGHDVVEGGDGNDTCKGANDRLDACEQS